MTKEFLPIRIFKEREADDLRVEGGGKKDTPNWVLSGEALSKHTQTLCKGFVDGLTSEPHNSALPYVYQVTIEKNSSAKSRRTAIVDMLTTSNEECDSSVVGMRGSSGLLIQASDEEAVHSIVERMSDVEKYERPISCIEDVCRFKPDIDLGKDCDTFKIRLLEFNDPEKDEACRRTFEEALDSVGVNYAQKSYADGLTVYKAKADNETLQGVLDGNVIESLFMVKPMPKVSAVLDSLDSSNQQPIIQPDEDETYPIVGVLDNGIEPIDHLRPWLYGDRWSQYVDSDIKADHGTFVGGVMVYGDELEGHNWTGTGPVRIHDASVFSATYADEDELINNIQEAVKHDSNEVKVWNLSISMNQEIDEDEFSEFAMALDDIQDKYGVLICKSAGNCTNFRLGNPVGKLHAGADSVRALTVGAAAQKKNPLDLADEGNAAPFSRIGPGPQYIIKPELVHYGGNAGVDPFGNIKQTGILSFNKKDQVVEDCGTSFSTPRVAAMAAKLQHDLDQDFDPLLIKALLVHSAQFPNDDLVPNDEKVNAMGFGIPSDIESILGDEPYEATLILRGTLPKGSKIDIMDFPMPECLIKNGYYTGQIVLTLVANPVLEPSQGGEYCQSNIDVKFGAYNGKKQRDITSPLILNPIGRNESQNVLLKTLYSKKGQQSPDDFALREQMLKQYGSKYYPVKKYAVDLAQLTPSNREKVKEGMSWYMEVTGVFRDFTERKARAEHSQPEQEFCAVITLRDPGEAAPVYNEVAQKLDLYGFQHETVKLHNETKVSVR